MYIDRVRACTQCGKCCLEYKGNSWLGPASETDLLVWLVFRPDILAYGDSPGDLWVSPVTGATMKRCPWLRKLPNQEKYKCRIHGFRPEVCQNYPIDIEQMIHLDCEMLEAGDLDKPRIQLITELEKMRNASES